jgi:hypothetical protein
LLPIEREVSATLVTVATGVEAGVETVAVVVAVVVVAVVVAVVAVVVASGIVIAVAVAVFLSAVLAFLVSALDSTAFVSVSVLVSESGVGVVAATGFCPVLQEIKNRITKIYFSMIIPPFCSYYTIRHFS